MQLMLVSVPHDAISVIYGTIPLLVYDDQNGIQHDIFGHVMLLASTSPSYNANGIINDTIANVSPR